MATLYPPYIEGKIPAQIGDTLRIPYQLNRAVGESDLQGAAIRARIKFVSTNALVSEDIVGNFEANSENDVYTANLPLENVNLTIGQYYKIQLAFEKERYTGQYYSTVGVFKYTTQPVISISNLKLDRVNSLTYKVIGVYENDDKSEKIDSYKFDIYQNNTIIESSGWMIHKDGQPDSYYIQGEHEGYYYITYSIRTTNGLEVVSPSYIVHNIPIVKLELSTLQESFVIQDSDNGIVKIGLRFNEPTILKGEYQILRYCEEEGWKILKTLLLQTSFQEARDNILYEDFTVKHGVEYTYALRQVNNDLLTDKLILGGPIVACFEDMFLYDGDKQLRVKFNPKVTSFKTTLLESKIDTIGSKYPTFFRNGQVNYKEFPISGLISYWMDENGRFWNRVVETEQRTQTINSKLLSIISTQDGLERATLMIVNPSRFWYDDIYKASGFNDKEKFKEWFTRSKLQELMLQAMKINNASFFPTTNLTDSNIAEEREFKLEVLNWLNNGQPKLFRSPAEGNYVVRLMNVNLAPEDRLGRMLHTFNANAYEIAESLDIEKIEEDITIVNNKTIILNTSEEVEIPNANKIQIAAPVGTVLTIVHENGDTREAMIPRTEYYEFDTEDPVINIKLTSGDNATITYWYMKEDNYPLIDIDSNQPIELVYANEVVNQIINNNNYVEEGRVQSVPTYFVSISKNNIMRFNGETKSQHHIFYFPEKKLLADLNMVPGNRYKVMSSKTMPFGASYWLRFFDESGTQLDSTIVISSFTGEIPTFKIPNSAQTMTIDTNVYKGKTYNNDYVFAPYIFSDDKKNIFENKNIKLISYLRIQKKEIEEHSSLDYLANNDLLKSIIYKINDEYFVKDVEQCICLGDKTAIDYTYSLNNQNALSLENQGRIEFTKEELENITSLTLGNGLYADMYYIEADVKLEGES